jgi:hypothetical protein
MQTVQGGFWEPDIVTRIDVESAEFASTATNSVLLDAQARLSALVEREGRLHDSLKKFERISRVRRLCDEWTTRRGGLILFMLCPSMFILISCHLLRLPPIVWPIPVLAGFASTGFFGIKLIKPDDASMESDMEAWNRELRSIHGTKWGLEADIFDAKSRADTALVKYQAVLRQSESRINRLRSTNWEILQGVPFEQFLASIFVEWGYDVSTTKVSGDQGVDLVISKNGLELAIQAKGYPSTTVGNSAVQEAHTGMKYYGCHRCVVITNSTFTSAARKLAEGVGCVLIDHDMIPLLIEGKIKL